MSAAAFFNGVERMFAPADVVARQRDQLLNMQGGYDAQTPAAPAPPAQPSAPVPDAAMAAHVTQGTARIGPVGVVGPSGAVAPGDMDPWTAYEMREAQARQEEAGWDAWASANNIDKMPSREIGLSSGQTPREILQDTPAWSDPRWSQLPLSWSQERRDKAIRFMRSRGG